MKNLGLILIPILLLLPFSIYSQVIVLVDKADNNKLNKLENLQVNLCFEMDNYVVVSPQATAELDRAKIPYRILTSDNSSSPLYIISAKPGINVQKQAYLDKIILDDDIRIEASYDSKRKLPPQAGIKFIPVRVSPQLYQNKILTFKQAANINRDFDEAIAAVNADSVAYFIQKLEDYETRFALLDNRREISEWIASQFTRFGYNDVAIDSFYVEQYNTWQYNVVCTEEGSQYPDQYLVVGGHHDSIITPNINAAYTYAPGADDNASGSAAVLETARVMKLHNIEPKSSIRFMTYAMEEFGLYGSHYDAENQAANNTNIIAMLNSDMISNCQTDDFAFTMITYPGTQALTDIISENSADLEMTTYLIDSASSGSDSWAYHSNGFPAVFFAEENFSPFYHSAYDISENTNPEYAAQFIKLIALSTFDIANLPSSPQNFLIQDSGDGTSVVTSWDPLTVEGVSYFLEVKDLITSNVLEFSTANTSLTISNLTDNNPYQITLYSQVDGDLSFGVSKYITPQSLPNIVEEFTYQADLFQINFSWAANSELDLAGYNLYRKLADQSDFNLLASLDSQTLTYIDNTTESGLWYNYQILARDNAGNESPYSHSITARHLSFDSGIAIFDYTSFSDNNLLFPSQNSVQEFYENALENYDYDLIYPEQSQAIKIDDLGIYSTVIIFKNSFSAVSNQYLAPVLEEYVNYGGNLLLSAADPLKFLRLNNDIYPSSFTEDDLPYQLFGLSQTNSNSTARFARGQAIAWDMPDLEVDPDKIYPTFNNRLFNIEAMTANNQSQVTGLFTYQSDSSNELENEFDNYLVAISKSHANSEVIITSIPLYFIQADLAKDFMENALTSFNESVDNDNLDMPQLLSSLALRNYPNPFNPQTSIQFTLPSLSNVNLKIYNVKGQLVYSQRRNNLQTGQHTITWHGKDNNDKALASGIYLYKLSTDTGLSQTRKMILMK